jgi:cobalt/nickel transport system permease protein
MRLDAIERYSALDGPLQRLDARVKIAATLVYVLAVVATPLGAWRALTIEALLLAFVVGVSGVPPRALVVRWFGFFALFGFLTMMVAPARPERAQYGVAVVAASLIVKDALAFVATILLVQVTAFPALLVGLRRLRVPATLVATLQFMYRYAFVLTDELDRMVVARRARSFRRSARFDWGMASSLIGVLFLRAFERGERVHAAMLARGWDGTPRALDD